MALRDRYRDPEAQETRPRQVRRGTPLDTTRRPLGQEAVISDQDETWIEIKLRLEATDDTIRNLADEIGTKFVYEVSTKGCTLQAPQFEGKQPVDFDEEAEMTTLALFCSMIQYKTRMVQKNLNTHHLDLEVK